MNEHRPLRKRTSRVPLRECREPEARRAMLRDHGHDGDPPGPVAGEIAAAALIENAVGVFPAGLGVATNFIVNGEERLVAMATEERSVIAAASYAAKLCRDSGGFRVSVEPQNGASGQVLFADLPRERDIAEVLRAFQRETADLIAALEDGNPMRKHGGGMMRLEARRIAAGERGPMLAVTFEVDVVDAMGANVVTRIGETLAELCRPIVGARRTAVICTNDAQGPSAVASAVWPASVLGDAIIERVLDLQAWADGDERRAVTHNKGVMNGVSAVALATGQDVRAVEASAHASATTIMASRSRYAPLTAYRRTGAGLEGRLFLRVPLGTVGGATAHPTAVWSRGLMGAVTVRDLAAICGAVGLAQNFAALRSLADEGIPEAHARLKGKR